MKTPLPHFLVVLIKCLESADVMKDVTFKMIKDFKLERQGIDFMGYGFDKISTLSFHHLIIAHRDCQKFHIPNQGYVYWNGAILKQDTSHDYLHTIERVDEDMFIYITAKLVEENKLGRLDKDILMQIRDVLERFEREHCSDRTHNNKALIKERYTIRPKL